MNPKTDDELVRKTDILNRKYFKGQLRVISRFGKRKVGSRLGNCAYNRRTGICLVEINPLLKGYDISETLLHELIHVQNFQELGRSSHGAEFKIVAKRIYKQSDGKYDLCGHCTDKKLNEVVVKWATQQRKARYERKRSRLGA